MRRPGPGGGFPGVQDLVVWRGQVRFMGRRFPAAVGRTGITGAKREGDGATPAGVHRIIGMLYRADRIGRGRLHRWAHKIGPRDLWSDASGQADYNRQVRAPYGFSHERLSRPDPMYDVIVLTDWNWPDAKPGRGSAIFLHQWRRPGHPTAGCIAVCRDHLIWIAARIRPGTRLVVKA